ncbi:hypothetical protein G9A89_006289 [Geosiphon pyriformis]|nr:hypothetical protein G9A89_006289 [Geosiphon pyriformis]
MDTYCSDNKEYQMATKFYCCPCFIDCFGRPKQVEKWDNEPCLACGETFLDKGIWNNISEREEICDKSCQYTILISNWIRKETLIDAVWRQAVKRLDSCPHNDDKIWQMTLAKIEGTSLKEKKTIKNNPLEPIELDWNPKPVINFLDLEQFYEHYQELVLTREEQEQCLEKINTQLCDYL